MSYTFPAFTDEELNAVNLIEPGFYNFEVAKAERQTSQKGNPMAKLTLKIWDNAGKTQTLFDYLVFSNVPLNIRKVKHFCDAVGLVEEYRRRELPEELAHYCGKVEIGIEEEQPKKEGGMYPRKNKVVDYVMTDKGAVKHENIASKQHAEEPFFNDDVPF